MQLGRWAVWCNLDSSLLVPQYSESAEPLLVGPLPSCLTSVYAGHGAFFFFLNAEMLNSNIIHISLLGTNSEITIRKFVVSKDSVKGWSLITFSALPILFRCV